MKKKTVVTKKRRTTASPPPPAPALAPMPSPKPAGMGFRNGAILALLAIVGTWSIMRHPSAFVPAPPNPGPAAPIASNSSDAIQAAWGSSLSLDKLDSFKAPLNAMDLYAKPNGDVIVLTGDSLNLFVAGKLSRTAGIGSGPNRSLACDGKTLYVSNSDNASIGCFNLDLAYTGVFAAAKARRLLGLTWAASKGALAAVEVDGQPLYLISPKGKVEAKLPVTLPAGDGTSFAYDVAPGPGDSVLVTNIYKGSVTVQPLNGKAGKVLSELCPSMNNRRVALLNGLLYVPCQPQGVVLVVNAVGRVTGYLKAKNVSQARAGADGALYLLADGSVLKYKVAR